MALPGFYNEADQAIYASGDKFIPQEQYRLGYTHPPSATQEAGITNTQAASPYIWPPQGYYPGAGGNGGGGGGLGKYNLNPDNVYGFGHQLMYEDIVNKLLNKKSNALEGDKVLDSVKIIEAMYKSIKLKKEIFI